MFKVNNKDTNTTSVSVVQASSLLRLNRDLLIGKGQEAGGGPQVFHIQFSSLTWIFDKPQTQLPIIRIP